MMKSFYQDHEKGRNSLTIWVLCILIFLVCFCAVFYLSPLGTLEFLLAGGPGIKLTNFIRELYLPEIFWAYFRPSIFFLLALWIAQKKLRHRPFIRLINGRPLIRFRWKRFLAAMVVFVFLALISWMIVYFFKNILTSESLAEKLWPINDPYKLPVPGHPFTNWVIILAPLIVFNALIQEMVFRGFIDQGLSRLLASPFVVFTLSGLLYALSHISFETILQYNQTGEWAVFFVFSLNLVIYGIFLSILTYMDNGIEAAVGLSFASTIYVESISLPYFQFLEPGASSFLSYEMVNLMDTITFYLLALVMLAFWQFGLGEKQDTPNA